MSDKYEKIRNMKRPQFAEFPPMPLRDRAAQFSPFAAVVGYGDAVMETARLTDEKVNLHGDAAFELDLDLARLREMIAEQPRVKVTYFVPDERKAGGKYVEKEGVVRRFDEVERVLIFQDGASISISEIRSVEIL